MHKKETLIKHVLKSKDAREQLRCRFVDTDGAAYTTDGLRCYVERHTGEAPTEVASYPIEAVRKTVQKECATEPEAQIIVSTASLLSALKVAKVLYEQTKSKKVCLGVNGTLEVEAMAEAHTVKTTIEDGNQECHGWRSTKKFFGPIMDKAVYEHEGQDIAAAFNGCHLTEAVEFVAGKDDALVCLAFHCAKNPGEYTVTLDNGNGRVAVLMGLHMNTP